MSHKGRLDNVFVLLSNGTNKIASTSSTAMLGLPTNEELSYVTFDHTPEVKNHASVVDLNLLCVVVWKKKLKKKLNGSLVMPRRYWKINTL